MKILKVLGGISLIAGGLALAFFGSKKDQDENSIDQNNDNSDNEDFGDDEVIDDGRDLNPYNRPDCLVPPEAYNDNKRKNNNKYSDDFFEEPHWVRRAKLYAEGIPNIARGLLNTVSDTYQLYGTCRADHDVDTYRDEYNNRYSNQYRRMNTYSNGGYFGNSNHRFYY